MSYAAQRAAWSKRLPTGYEAFKRASGRRRYNQERHEQRMMRWGAIVTAYPQTLSGSLPRGFQAQLARELGLNRSTICRDLAGIRRNLWRTIEAAEWVWQLLDDEAEEGTED